MARHCNLMSLRTNNSSCHFCRLRVQGEFSLSILIDFKPFQESSSNFQWFVLHFHVLQINISKWEQFCGDSKAKFSCPTFFEIYYEVLQGLSYWMPHCEFYYYSFSESVTRNWTMKRVDYLLNHPFFSIVLERSVKI